jgi:RNA polymerase sigma-32 factor
MATKKRRCPLIIDHATEQQLAKAYLESGDVAARDRLINAYAPLASSLAIQVARQSGMHLFEDLQQEANAALVGVVDRFDPALGYRFGTFARWHILSDLRRFVMDNVGCCRVGTNAADKKVFTNFRKERAKIEAETGRPLDEDGREQIAKALKVDIEVIYRMEPRVLRSDVAVDTLITAQDDEEAGYGEQLIDTAPSPEAACAEGVDRSRVRDALAEAIDSLDGREMRIIHARYLLTKPISLQSLADEMKISRKAVQSIENRAFNRLQHALREQGISAEEALGHL